MITCQRVCVFSFLLIAAIYPRKMVYAADTLPEVKAAYVEKGPVIDGRLEDAVWSGASEESGFHVYPPVRAKDAPAVQPTGFRVVYDNDALYIGVRCGEPDPGKIKVESLSRDGGVYHDDSVEIFIDPAGLRSEYYHLMVNAKGIQGDLYCAEKGQIKDSSYDAPIEAKTSLGSDHWSVEIRVPFSAFSRIDYSEIKREWTFNVCRTRKAGGTGELYTWAPVQYSFHDPDRFGRLLMDRLPDLMRFNYRMNPLNLAVLPEDNGGFRAALNTEIANATRQKKDLKYRVRVPGLAVSGEKAVTVEKDGRAELKVDDLVLPSEGTYDFWFEVLDGKTGTALAVLRQSMPVGYRLFSVEIKEPFYRNSIYPDEKVTQIRGRLNVYDSKKFEGAHAEIRMQGKDLSERKELTSVANGTEFVFENADKLDVGDYSIAVKLLNGRNEVIGEDSVVVRKLPPFEGTITRIDKNLNFVINGSPVIAAGWYGYEYLMGECRRMGAEEPRQVNISLGIDLDEAVSNNMVGCIGLELRRLFPGMNEKEDRLLSDAEKTKIKDIVERYKHHPGLGFWYLSDEPGSRSVSKILLGSLYEYVKELDPYHVTVLVDRHPDKYVNFSDVYSPHPYLTPMQDRDGRRWMRVPMTDIRDKMRLVLDSGRRRKAVWVTPGCHSYRALLEDAVNPSFQEMRCMLYTALVNGARGFMPYTKHEAWEDYDTRYGVLSFYEELYHLEPVLLNGQVQNADVSSPSNAVDCLLIKKGKGIFLFAVNTSPEPCEAIFVSDALKGAKLASVLREDRAVQLDEGTLKDAFEGYDVHLYTTDTFPYMDTLKEVREEIEWRKRHTRDNIIFNDRSVIIRTNDGRKGYNQNALFNGVIDSPAWIAVAPPRGEALWLELSRPRLLEFSKVVLYSCTLRDYEIQAWANGKWETFADAKNDVRVKKEHQFPSIRTVKVRVVIRKSAGLPEINEIALF
jgi:hypothetical protein